MSPEKKGRITELIALKSLERDELVSAINDAINGSKHEGKVQAEALSAQLLIRVLERL